MADGVPIVLDNGECYLKAGFAGESAPRSLVPMLTARSYTARGSVDWFVGAHAKSVMKQLPTSCPISRGIIINGEELSMIWHYTFTKELREDPKNHPLLVTEFPDTTKKNRERLADIVFEKFKVPALYISRQSALALYASGLSTGVSVDIGKEVANIVPVQDSYSVPDATKTTNVGGAIVTNYLQQLLTTENPGLSKFITNETACFFKENSCFISAGLSKEVLSLTASNPASYQAPDGNILKIGRERCIAPEMLFRPEQFGLKELGVHQAVLAAIKACPAENQSHIASHIVLSGGGTLIKGFPERLQTELSNALSETKAIRVVAPNDRRYSVWIGGSILASLSTFCDVWVSKSEYEENGANIVFQKCL